MSLSFLVGGTKGTFEERFAQEVAGVLDLAFGGEEEWEGTSTRRFGEIEPSGWAQLLARAEAELGASNLPNLTALGPDGRGVFLPTSIRSVALPLSEGRSLRCAGLPGLRRELAELAERWGLPSDEETLEYILAEREEGELAEPPEIVAHIQLILAANEAVRRGCPLWLVGE